MTTELRLIPENKPTDRFQLTDKPMVSPAKCACCGAPDRAVVDFGMTLQFYGAVLLCVTCLAEAARIIGMVPGTVLAEAELSATQSLSDQLTSLGMRTITDEQFQFANIALSGLSDALLSISLGDVGESKGQERLFDFVDGDSTGKSGIVEFPDSVTEQGNSDVISEGPDSVSASNGNGAYIFSL